jgi:iron-sulfur cluster assembly protein
MPSGEELRLLEDRWMDEGSTSDGGQESGALGAGIDAEGGLLGSGGSSGLDDMLWGSMMGFFWPVGCAVWLLREEGIWSWRKGLAVFVGVVVNCGFGAVRVLT